MYANEIYFNKFNLKAKVFRGDSQWSAEINYDDKPLIIQTPVVTSAYDLKGYKYANKSQEKFNINVLFDSTIEGTDELMNVIKELDKMTNQSVKEDEGDREKKYKFKPSLIQPKKENHLPRLKCKLVSNSWKFKFEAYVNENPIKPTIKQMKKLIKRGTKMELNIKLNPIWCSGTEYGISWQIVGMNIITENIGFRGWKKYKSFRPQKENYLNYEEDEQLKENHFSLEYKTIPKEFIGDQEDIDSEFHGPTSPNYKDPLDYVKPIEPMETNNDEFKIDAIEARNLIDIASDECPRCNKNLIKNRKENKDSDYDEIIVKCTNELCNIEKSISIKSVTLT